MMKKITGILVLCLLTSVGHSGSPYKVELDTVTAVYIDDSLSARATDFGVSETGLIVDYGSSSAQFLPMTMTMKDPADGLGSQRTTSELEVSIPKTNMVVNSSGKVIDYENPDVPLAVRHKVYNNRRHPVIREVKIKGALRVVAGGVVRQPQGMLRFTLPPCDGTRATTYDWSFSGRFSGQTDPL